MATEEIINGKVHHGHNIRRVRTEKGIKQESIAEMMKLAQSTISKYENTRRIEDEVLNHFARTLKVPVELLKNMEEDMPMVIFENNTVNNSDHAQTNVEYALEDNHTSNFNPIEKITELYERLLKEKDEKYAALEKRLENLTNNPK